MRERFWIGENRRYEVLQQLKSAEGIEEAVVLSTCCRTEFLLWASEPTLAANSLLQFLGADHGLKLTEWEHFYRLLDEAALTQTAGLDCLSLAEAHIVPRMKAAWEQAQTVGAAGRFLNAILERALSVSEKVRTDTAPTSARSRFPRPRWTCRGRSLGHWTAAESYCWVPEK